MPVSQASGSIPANDPAPTMKVTKTRSEIMAAIRSKHTGPELLLRKHLSKAGLRYRLHRAGLY